MDSSKAILVIGCMEKAINEIEINLDLLQTKDEKTLIKVLVKLLKATDTYARKRATLLFGNIGKISALTPLCNIALFDCDEGVRIVTTTAILDIARKNPRNMQIAKKVATHPLLTSLQKFPTPSYGRCIGWILSQLEFSEDETESVITILQRKSSTLISSSCKRVLEEVIEILKRR